MMRQRRGGSFRLSAIDRLEEFGRKRAIRSARLEIPRELHRDRIRQIAQDVRQIPHDGIRRREAGANQHQGGDPLRLCERCVPRDEAAERMPDQRRALDLEGIENADDVRRQFGNGIAGFRAIRVPEAALVDGHGTKALGQERQDTAEREPGVGPPVKEDDGLAIAIAAFHVVETRPGPQTHVGKSRRRTFVHATHRSTGRIAEQRRPAARPGSTGRRAERIVSSADDPFVAADCYFASFSS